MKLLFSNSFHINLGLQSHWPVLGHAPIPEPITVIRERCSDWLTPGAAGEGNLSHLHSVSKAFPPLAFHSELRCNHIKWKGFYSYYMYQETGVCGDMAKVKEQISG